MGRTATGVRGMRLDNEEDEAVGMLVMQCNEALSEEQWAAMDAADAETVENEELPDDTESTEEQTEVQPFVQDIMVVSEKGYGKRSALGDYRITRRGGKGVKTLNLTDKTGKLIAIKAVTDDDDLMIINKSGVTIRLALSEVRVQGRNTQGVSLINLKKRNDVISSVCRVEHEEPEDEVATDVAEAGEEASPNASEGGKVPTNE